MNTHEKFLSFNGKNIVFLNKDGQYWIAVKPICEALGVNYDRQYKNLKDNPILAPAYAIQHIQVLSENGVLQGRKMVCLPEKYIYGWIFSINSESPELWDYKKTCYDILYSHFHGIITNQKELLLNQMDIDSRIYEIKEEL